MEWDSGLNPDNSEGSNCKH